MKLGASKLAALAVFVAVAQASAEGMQTDPDRISPAQLADNIYVLYGFHAFPDKHNKGLISNSGIILTEAGAVLVDTGGSAAAGRIILSNLRKLTDLPVVAVFNTHFHGDHWLGNEAIRDAFPEAKIYAHERALERLVSGEAERWHEVMSRIAGPEIAGNHPVVPDHGLKGGDSMVIGGVEFKFHHIGPAHTNGDLMIEIPSEKLLFSGDLIVIGNMPSFGAPQDMDVKGQIAALDYISTMPVETVVPGHGAAGTGEIAQTPRRFFTTLHDSVKKYYDQGMQDYQMRDMVTAELSEFSQWHGFSELGRMISYVYLKVEEEDFQ